MKSKINISIDDVSPHPKSSVNVLSRCYEVIDRFPEVKFSLFIPISYWRTIKPEIATRNPLQIDLFPDFCEIVKGLPKQNFELCYHGFHHGIPGKSDNDEFQYLNEADAKERFQAMFEVVKRANLQDVFKPVFRPPAWRMSPGAIRAARKSNIEILALSPKEYAKKTYEGEEDMLNDIVYFDCAPPFDPLALHKKTEIVYHACEWDKNYLSKTLTEELIDFIEREKNQIEFCFIKDLLNG